MVATTRSGVAVSIAMSSRSATPPRLSGREGIAGRTREAEGGLLTDHAWITEEERQGAADD
jgi:hypothetical protein